TFPGTLVRVDIDRKGPTYTVDTLQDLRLARPEADIRRALEQKHPIDRLIRSDEVADVVELCILNSALNGQGIVVDGGAVQS
ncbi:hypothetical protein ACFQ1S_41100, partial [Kibdelosporangium lantanae]